MWRIINTILGRSHTKDTGSIKKMRNAAGETSSQSRGIANILNNYFSNIGQELSAQLPHDLNEQFRTYMSSVNGNDCHFRFKTVTEAEISKIIAGMNNSGPGSDGLPMFIFKENISSLSAVIAHICNLTFLSGSFPEQLNVGKVTCLFKKGERDSPGNYRPISILPSMSKL